MTFLIPWQPESVALMPELIWDAKYQDGKRAGPVRIALPFQTVETVNESAQDRQRSLDLFSSGREGEWRNRLPGGPARAAPTSSCLRYSRDWSWPCR